MPARRRYEAIRRGLALTIVLAALAAAGPALAAGSAEGVFDEALVAEAKAAIGRMCYDELAAFRFYLAACIHERQESEVAQHGCDVALAGYQIEFAAERPLDHLLESIEATDLALRDEDRTRTPHDLRIVRRLTGVEYELRQRTSARFRELRGD